MNHINVPYLGWVSASGESSQSSGSSIIPTSIKCAHPKRKASDEDVWDYSDMKIIGTKINLCCTFFVSSSVMQNWARRPGNLVHMITTTSHLSGVMIHVHLPSGSPVALTQMGTHHQPTIDLIPPREHQIWNIRVRSVCNNVGPMMPLPLLLPTLGARVSRNEWEHLRSISRSGSILLHCNQQIHLWNI